MSEDSPTYGKPKPPTLAELVAAEREKQRAKGYTAEHDDKHVNGELANAAACYAHGHELWVAPWDVDDVELTDRPQQIVIAIALLEAEYERLMRAK